MSNIFLGLPIPATDGELLLNLLWEAHPHWRNHPAIRWSGLANHHCTLHFFGPIRLELLSDLINALGDYIKYCNSFSIRIIKLHNFPKLNSDLIAAYAHLSSPLANLHQQIQQAVKNHGFPVEERPFLPHITLCRAKRRNILHMDPILLPNHAIKISQLILYQTQSTPPAAIINHYTNGLCCNNPVN